MLADMAERQNDLVSQHANPRDIMEYCQKALPRLDDAFHIAMMYAPLDLKLEFQHDYIVLRQSLLNDLVQAQSALAKPTPKR
jgi:hypothetical protein